MEALAAMTAQALKPALYDALPGKREAGSASLPPWRTSISLLALSTRWTEARLMPMAVASERTVQRPAGGGVASKVRRRESALAVTVTFRPRPGASRMSAEDPPA